MIYKGRYYSEPEIISLLKQLEDEIEELREQLRNAVERDDYYE